MLARERIPISDCLILNPGHCGITVYSGSTIDVARNIITGSRYHGVRSTGGTLNMHDNLIIRNKNRGIYLGNKSASGHVSNNVILGNGTGISAKGYPLPSRSGYFLHGQRM